MCVLHRRRPRVVPLPDSRTLYRSDWPVCGEESLEEQSGSVGHARSAGRPVSLVSLASGRQGHVALPQGGGEEENLEEGFGPPRPRGYQQEGCGERLPPPAGGCQDQQSRQSDALDEEECAARTCGGMPPDVGHPEDKEGCGGDDCCAVATPLLVGRQANEPLPGLS